MFVLGVLYDKHGVSPEFLQPKPRPTAKITISTAGVSASKSQDFTLYAKDGLKTEGDKASVSGFGGPISIFNDSLEVELDFDKSFWTVPVAQVTPPSSDSGSPSSTQTSLSGRIVASKSGTKYYYESCSEVNRIKKENLVYFKSEAEAKANGYDASSCVEKAK